MGTLGHMGEKITGDDDIDNDAAIDNYAAPKTPPHLLETKLTRSISVKGCLTIRLYIVFMLTTLSTFVGNRERTKVFMYIDFQNLGTYQMVVKLISDNTKQVSLYQILSATRQHMLVCLEVPASNDVLS